MQRHHLQMILVFFGILATGTAGYLLIEGPGWTVLDALYMTFITITTVGFGETHNLSPGGRVFTMFLLAAGLGSVAVFSTQVAKLLIESELSNILGRKKMRDRLARLNGHSIICGYGRIGRAIALSLHAHGLPFAVLDHKDENLAEAEQMGFLTVKGNASADATLLAAGIRRAACLVLCIPDDAVNTFVTLAARELNPKIHILARGTDPAVEERMIRAGADSVVYPLKLGGEQIARLIVRQAGLAPAPESGSAEIGVLGYRLNLFRHFGSEPITVAQALAQTGASAAVALRRGSGQTQDSPAPDAVLGEADTLVILVHESAKAQSAGQDFPDWQANLTVGVAAMDEEHRELFKLIRRYREAVSQGRGAEAAGKVFDTLIEYTARHFRHEEALMAKAGYPDLEAHRDLHKKLTAQVLALHRDKHALSTDSLGAFLDTWLRTHIMKMDREAAACMKEQGLR